MIYNMTIFEKKKFTDQDRRYIQPPSLIRNGGKTGHLLQRGTYPIIVLTSCPNNI